MRYFFTSDTHYGHARVIQYSERPFESVEQMQEEMIERWNAVVGPNDFVYHLGDFAFVKPRDAIRILSQLNGHKHLVWGNHDKRLRESKEFVSHWVWCKDFAEIKIADTKVVLCHYPLLTWNKSHYGSWMLHGHCHGTLKPDPHARRVDVGVDCWDYVPATYEGIADVMATKDFVPVDHHAPRDHEET